jgi:crossover junction endodeoxyribonuclease RusA
MKHLFTLELPYPPSVNHYWGQRGKIRFLTAKAKKFRQDVTSIVQEYHCDNDLDGRFKLEIVGYPPDRRKRDVDNIVKPVLDAFEHANVYTNDVCVTQLHVHKMPFEGKDASRIIVKMWEDLS